MAVVDAHYKFVLNSRTPAWHWHAIHACRSSQFPLRTDLQKPFYHRQLDHDQRIYNYRLSRAWRVVENAFGIFANRLRVFRTTINLHPDKVVKITLASCVIHNFLRAWRLHFPWALAHIVQNAYLARMSGLQTTLSVSSFGQITVEMYNVFNILKNGLWQASWVPEQADFTAHGCSSVCERRDEGLNCLDHDHAASLSPARYLSTQGRGEELIVSQECDTDVNNNMYITTKICIYI